MFPEGLFPSINGLHLEALHIDTQSITAVLAIVTPTATCPRCAEPAIRIHSRYVRTPTDLPWAGIRVRLQITVRRFFCDNAACSQRIFAERLGKALPAFARRTDRLAKALCAFAFAAGGEGGARLAHAQAMPVSPRTMLRLLQASPLPQGSPPRVVGIDEWAWKKGRSYGTIFVDLERKQPVDVLSDRDATSVEAWFKKHQSVEIIVRDRSGLFADGARRGAPLATQALDRFHLVKNLVEALERFFLHKRTVLKGVHQAQNTQQDPSDLGARLLPIMQGTPSSSKAEEASLRRHAHSKELYQKIHELAMKKVDVANIARQVGVSRETAYRYLRMNEPPQRTQIRYTRRQLIEPYKPYLLQRWNEGCRNAQQMYREISAMGYTAGVSNVSRFIGHLRKDSGKARSFKQTSASYIYGWKGEQNRPLTALQAARLCVSREQTLQAWQKEALRRLGEVDEEIEQTIRHVHSFVHMVRQLQGERLDAWLEEVEDHGTAPLRAFAQSLRKEYQAAKAGLTLPWSNGPTEAQIQRLKLLKRQMYGQAGFPLLRQRVLHRGEKRKTQPRKAKKTAPLAA